MKTPLPSTVLAVVMNTERDNAYNNHWTTAPNDNA